MTKTTATKDYAGPGAVNQHGGQVRVYICNACGAEVVWVESKRTDKHYLCNVRRGQADQRYYIGTDFHPRDCAERKAARIQELVDREQAHADAIAELRELERLYAPHLARRREQLDA